MAAMSTALTQFSDKENSRTYTTSGHTSVKPKLVIQKRRVPTGNQVIQEDTISVIHGTEDSNGVVLSQKVSFQVTVRQPVTAADTAVADALAIFKDMIAGDEFANTVTSSEYLS
jgi:hypothetical protein